MKRIIAFILVCISVLSLAACANKTQTEEVPKTLNEDIPNAYVGDTVIEDTVKLGQLEIIIKEKTFYINGIKFAFSEFKDSEKLSMQFEDGMLDVYVSDNTLQKCVLYSEDNTVCTQYDIEGRCVSQTKTVYDEYGNGVLVCTYDAQGKLQSFYEASFDRKCNMTQKKEFNSTYDLVQVTNYEYDESGKLARELIYGADLKLADIKEHE